MADVVIHKVTSDITITESVGPLSPQEVRRLVDIVLQKVAERRDEEAARRRDTAIRNQVWNGDTE
jgi:hypothetical protein